MRAPLRILAATLGLMLAGSHGHAQCQTQWQPGEPAPGPRVGQPGVTAWWDPDGPGPRSALLVIGGQFTIPSVGASNLATYDPVTGRWGAFPTVPNGNIVAIAAMPNGDLAVGGPFAAVGAQAIADLAIWDGAHWSSPGGGVAGNSTANPRVQALQALANGDLVAGGSFTSAGNVAAAGLARWDGSRWHALGAFQGEVMRMAPRPNGNLVVAGSFREPGTANFANIAEWDGANWITYGVGIQLPGCWVTALAVLANGDVVIAGLINNAGGITIHNIARWDGANWSDIGIGVDPRPTAFLPLANGDLLAATITVANQVNINGVARWDGSVWHPHASRATVSSMTTLPSGELLVTGGVIGPAGNPIRGLARWDGSTWHGLSNGFDDAVRTLVPLPNGDLVACGDFTQAGGTAALGVARWNGAAWWPMASPAAPPPWSGNPSCGTVDAAGILWLAGRPSNLPNQSCVARWSGNGWQAVGSGVGSITSIAIPGNQQPIVGCASYPSYGESIVQWNGLQWARFGAGLDGPVYTVLLRHGGELVAGGDFMNSGAAPRSRIAHWDGTAWRSFGTGLDGPVRALAELPNGELIAAGDFIMDGIGLRSLNLVARWDGLDWQPLGTGLAGDPGASVRALLVLPNGDLLAGGNFGFAGGAPARGIARWNGATWQAVDGGVDGTVLALAQLADGEVVAGGNFAMAGAVDAAHLARLRTTCPATATAYGTGCAGSAGMLDLVHAGLPWIGATFRSTCYGVSATGIGVDLFGLRPLQVPLATLHPAAGAACLLLLQPDAAILRLPAHGAIESNFVLPGDPVFIGMQLHQQMLVGEANAALSLTHLASSNGLLLRIGSL